LVSEVLSYFKIRRGDRDSEGLFYSIKNWGEEQNGDKLKIFVAEDKETTQKFYGVFLLEDIFEKRFIISGEEALELYRIRRPDIIILDIVLPLLSFAKVMEH